ncbi:MAG: HAD family phosphatase [Tannerellaceae bacterium]
MEGIKNLIIDFGGVIINLNRPRCLASFQAMGFDSIESLITTTYLQKGFFRGIEEGSVSPEEFRADVRKLIPNQVTDEQIDAAWNAMLVDVPAYKLELLLRLRSRFNTLLLSNTNQIHWEFALKSAFQYKGLNVADFFNKIYLSYELHLLKPNPVIFEYVLRDANIRPEETLFIDDAQPNCDAAERLGIHTYSPKAGEDWSHLFE